MSLDWAAVVIFGHDGRGAPRRKLNREGREVYDFFVRPALRNTSTEVRVSNWTAANKTFQQMVRVAEKHGRNVRVLVYNAD